MKIFILTLGTRGDLELFITLGRELQQRGHQVLIGTSPFYASRLDAAGLNCRQIGNGTAQQMQQVLADLADVQIPAERTMRFIQRWVKPQLDASASTLFSYALSADYFISNMKMAIPRKGSTVPGAFVTYDLPEPGIDMSAAPDNYNGRIIELVAMNQQLADPHETWNPAYRFTGFWLPSMPAWTPSAKLTTFLSKADRPIVFTLGSMTAVGGSNLAELFIQAARQFDQRVIIIGDQPGSRTSEHQSTDVQFESEVPYQWLFPQAAGIAHHGGIGTTAACLAAGQPCIILPQISAQHSLAQMVSASGAAAAVISKSDLTLDNLSDAIHRLTTSGTKRKSAVEWQHKIARDRGIVSAADLIEQHYKTVQ